MFFPLTRRLIVGLVHEGGRKPALRLPAPSTTLFL